MYDKNQTVTSKFLSFILRHHPEFIDVKLDNGGWVSVNELLEKINYDRPNKLHLSQLRYIVKTDSKQRFAIKVENGVEYIRAQYGHSIVGIDLGYEELEPPEFLYHGTATKYIDSINEYGLLHKGRQFVHLTEDKKVALSTGQRHGTPVVLKVAAKKLWQQNDAAFYKTPNGLWLTKYVEPQYLEVISAK